LEVYVKGKCVLMGPLGILWFFVSCDHLVGSDISHR